MIDREAGRVWMLSVRLEVIVDVDRNRTGMLNDQLLNLQSKLNWESGERCKSTKTVDTLGEEMIVKVDELSEESHGVHSVCV
jgi:hypothetical protein